MSILTDALSKAVVTREIDLSECSDIYDGIKLPVRVNWPRSWKKQRWELSRELNEIRLEREGDAEKDIGALNKRADDNAASWTGWWGAILMMTPEEVDELRDNLPGPHWEWLTARAISTNFEYEVEETKKVHVSRGRTSGEPEPSPRKSGTA